MRAVSIKWRKVDVLSNERRWTNVKLNKLPGVCKVALPFLPGWLQWMSTCPSFLPEAALSRGAGWGKANWPLRR